MISKKCFTFEWLQKTAQEIKADPGLLEKAVHAFALLGHLADSGLDFVFKGGTSLLLHVPVIRRLSIDIDILCGVSPSEPDRILGAIAKMPPFLRYEESERGARGLPKRRHFKFFYPRSATEGFILLDVVEEKNIPHDVLSKKIAPPLLEIEREVLVRLPTVESLLADKLSAFAPKTIGILFEPPTGSAPDFMQIAKQLFDVGELFMLAENLNAIRSVYEKVFALENSYRGGAFQLRDALDDTLLTALRLSQHDLKGVTAHPDAVWLEKGRNSLQSHLVNHRFDLSAAKVAAAKAGLLSRLILSKDSRPLSHWRNLPPLDELRSLKIDGEWERLNRLKQAIPEAFHYWHQASLLK